MHMELHVYTHHMIYYDIYKYIQGGNSWNKNKYYTWKIYSLSLILNQSCSTLYPFFSPYVSSFDVQMAHKQFAKLAVDPEQRSYLQHLLVNHIVSPHETDKRVRGFREQII